MSKTFTVVRSATIPAPVERIFPRVVDLEKWVDWSPWEGLDPDLQRTYSDSTEGPGASYSWKGNRKVGEGSMTITDATDNERIVIDLRFLKPFKSESETTFTFDEQGGETTVTWRMTGPMTFMTRVMGIFFPMDKMVGPDFEKGLAQLEQVVTQGE